MSSVFLYLILINFKIEASPSSIDTSFVPSVTNVVVLGVDVTT